MDFKERVPLGRTGLLVSRIGPLDGVPTATIERAYHEHRANHPGQEQGAPITIWNVLAMVVGVLQSIFLIWVLRHRDTKQWIRARHPDQIIAGIEGEADLNSSDHDTAQFTL